MSSETTTMFLPSVRLQLRNHINDTVPTPAGLVSVYGPTVPLSIISTPYPQYAAVGINTSPDGFNRYNSFQTRFEKRYSKGLSLTAVYTFQKNLQSPNLTSIIGNTATPTTVGRTVGRSAYAAGCYSQSVAGQAGVRDPDNRNLDVAVTPDNIPNILNIATTYELPFGKGKALLAGSRVGSAVLGGWKLTQNWNFQSGIPMTINAPCNAISCRPNLLGDPNFQRLSHRDKTRRTSGGTRRLSQPAFGSNPAILTASDPSVFDSWWQFGNMSVRNPAVHAPGFWNTDMSLTREFHLSEVKYFSFRWEVYNALNHQNLGIPNNNWCLPPNADGSVDQVHQFGCQFGKITNVQTDPRAMQFGLKFYW